MIVYGPCEFGSGTKVSIGKDAVLSMGANSAIQGGSSPICLKGITFGDGCLLSWDVQVMDTDFHKIKDENGSVINSPRSVVIGNNVWIGSRCTIMKGTHISNGCVIAAGSIISKDLPQEKTIYAGQGRNVCELKKNITWED